MSLWTETLDEPPQRKTYGGAITHVLIHNAQHRSEILHLLQRLGVPDLPEGDVLSWEAACGRAELIPARPGAGKIAKHVGYLRMLRQRRLATIWLGPGALLDWR